MPLDINDLSAYPSQDNSALEQWKAARTQKWAQVKQLLRDGNAAGAKALIAELEQDAYQRNLEQMGGNR